MTTQELADHSGHEVVHTVMTLNVNDADILDGELIIQKNRHYEEFNPHLRCNTCQVTLPIPDDYTDNS